MKPCGLGAARFDWHSSEIALQPTSTTPKRTASGRGRDSRERFSDRLHLADQLFQRVLEGAVVEVQLSAAALDQGRARGGARGAVVGCAELIGQPEATIARLQ
jgi:hypothetical protein